VPAQSNTSVATASNPFDAKWHTLKGRSISRANFAWLITHEIFQFNELKSHNVKGVGKEKLDSTKMEQVKLIAETYYPYSSEEVPYKAWRQCEKNIDTYLRKNPYTVKIGNIE